MDPTEIPHAVGILTEYGRQASVHRFRTRDDVVIFLNASRFLWQILKSFEGICFTKKLKELT